MGPKNEVAISPQRMFFARELPDGLAELSNGLRVIVDGLLEDLVLLHEVLSRDLVLAAVLHHHVKFLLAHPRLRLIRIEQVLLRFLPLGQVVLALFDGVCIRLFFASLVQKKICAML